jgi:hypothetical protein
MLLDATHANLGWPTPAQIFTPSGAGPGVLARLAQEKLGRQIARLPGGEGIQVGILANNPAGDATESPIAVVCEFPRPVPASTIQECVRLAWNFCRSRMLITLEPCIIRAWSCWEIPALSEDSSPLEPVDFCDIDIEKGTSLTSQAAQSLHWIELATGAFFQKNEPRFRRNEKADRLLLENLRDVRLELKRSGLEDDTVHDLLARLIFVQFLMQRLDKSGVPALSPAKLAKLAENNTLSRKYHRLQDVLSSKDDTYRLFRWLNDIFNGDLFPGKGDTAEIREQEWRLEMDLVEQKHLETLALFIAGDLRLSDGQRCLWPMYAFDVIPLEFISSIYEEFVSKSVESAGAHYTPEHVVDLALDTVLPWIGEGWDISVLDPSCGSGIFLVKCFQRLVHRWRTLHPKDELRAATLHDLLARNIFGTDINKHAVRVASFSLLLAMCDEIDPRQYWTQVKFPRLRGKNLLAQDFFDEISFERRNSTFDLIVGNAPWGKGLMTDSAQRWAVLHRWRPANNEIGTLFLPRAASLAKDGAFVCMIQPAGAVLFNRTSFAQKYRRKLFSDFAVSEVANLSALRFDLFANSMAPSCLVTLRVQAPTVDDQILYYSVKPGELADGERILLEARDLHWVSTTTAATDPWIWTVLVWGTKRDMSLIRRIGDRNKRKLGTLRNRAGWAGGEGFKRGDRKRESKELANGTYVEISPQKNMRPFCIEGLLFKNDDPEFDSRHYVDESIFTAPILLIGKSYTVDDGFRSASFYENALFPASSVYGFHYPIADENLAAAVCALVNSRFATWFLCLTSGRAVSYRPEVLVGELMEMPIGNPTSASGAIADVSITQPMFDSAYADAVAKQWLQIKDAEWACIREFCDITLKDFRQPQLRVGSALPSPIQIVSYCEMLVSCLRAGFGSECNASAAMFVDSSGDAGPVRLIAVYLGQSKSATVVEKVVASAQIVALLKKLDEQCFRADPSGGGIFYRRSARVYDLTQMTLMNGKTANIPTAYIVKPNKLRYWTLSAAMADADDLAADIWTSENALTKSERQDSVAH